MTEAATLWDKARALDVEASRARKEAEPYSFWLGDTIDPISRFSTLHLCANVWRAAAVMMEGGDAKHEL